MGREICLHRPGLAQALAGGNPVLCLRPGNPQDHLHYERDRKTEPGDPQIDQDAGIIPDRGGRHKADLPGNSQLREGGRNVR